MKLDHKFTEAEGKWMDAIAVNYIIGQSDGYQLGYAQALNDFTSYIVDYWNSSDDNPQQSVLDAIVDLGVELGTRKQIAEDNVRLAKEEGYDQFYAWQIKKKDVPFVQTISLFTKQLDLNEENVQTEQENDHVEQESAQIEHKNAQDEQESEQTAADSKEDPQGEVPEESGSREETQPGPEQDTPKEVSPAKGYGKWAEYMGKALSTLEQNLIIKGMTEEGYSLSQIAKVVRLSQPSICNRKKKMKEAGELA